MLINIVNQNAERQLLAAVEKKDAQNALKSALHFHASKLPGKPSEEDVLLAVQPLLQDKQASIYCFSDGDLVITWGSHQKAFLERLCGRLYDKFLPADDETVHTYFDLNVHGEDLRLLCRHKIEALHDSPEAVTEQPTETSAKGTEEIPLGLTPEQIAAFKEMEPERLYRDKPVVLVVEDQPFSRSLLLSVLGHNYMVYPAENAMEALKLYLEHVPDIVFLDIEMPGCTGHEFAELINTFDSKPFIVMVTASNHMGDISRARGNNVKGFIVKPFSKQKILDSINKFQQDKKAPRRMGQ